MKRAFDTEGMRLATFQARLCASSLTRTKASSPVFLRRLMKSDYLLKVDEGNSALLSLEEDEAFKALDDQYGPSSYGKIRYSEEALYWIGWIYRYIAYTRRIYSRLVYRLIKPDYLARVYPVYHTQDEEWVLDRILQSHGLAEADLDINERYKAIARRQNIFPKLICPLSDK